MSSSRTISFLQLVIEADPDFYRSGDRPWVYEFSNGRRFIEKLPVYGTDTST